MGDHDNLATARSTTALRRSIVRASVKTKPARDADHERWTAWSEPEVDESGAEREEEQSHEHHDRQHHRRIRNDVAAVKLVVKPILFANSECHKADHAEIDPVGGLVDHGMPRRRDEVP